MMVARNNAGKIAAFKRWLRRCESLEDMLTQGHITLSLGEDDLRFRLFLRTGKAITSFELGGNRYKVGNSEHRVVVRNNLFIPRRVIDSGETHPEEEVLVDGKPVGWDVYLPNRSGGGDMHLSMTLPSVLSAVVYAELVMGERV